MADKIVVLRAGKVEQVGAPLELYNRPANQFVAGFIGSPRMNFLAGQVAPDGVRVEIPEVGMFRICAKPGAYRPGDAMTIGIRPEHVRHGHADANNVTGTVANVEQLGGLSYFRLAQPDITVQLAGQTRLGFGETTEINLPAEDLHVFDADGMTLPRMAGASVAA